jgi:hypothetical protein
MEQILSRDKIAMKHMPKVMQDELKKSGTRSFSTSTRSRMPDVDSVQLKSDANLFPNAGEGASPEAAAALASMIEQVQSETVVEDENLGLKFEKPVIPENLKTLNFRNRYDTLQDQFTKMMMESGKLTKAQRVWGSFLSFIGLISALDIANSIFRTWALFWTIFAHPLLPRLTLGAVSSMLPLPLRCPSILSATSPWLSTPWLLFSESVSKRVSPVVVLPCRSPTR